MCVMEEGSYSISGSNFRVDFSACEYLCFLVRKRNERNDYAITGVK